MKNELENRASNLATRCHYKKKTKTLFGNLIGRKGISHHKVKSYDDFNSNYQEQDSNSLDATTSRLPNENPETKKM